MKKSKTYTPLYTYFITLEVGGTINRVIQVEQGSDLSLYIKWHLSLASNKDGTYHNRSYVSYHSQFDIAQQGYRAHQYGVSGERIQESVDYRKYFITDYKTKPFFQLHWNSIPSDIVIKKPTREDVVFKIEPNDNVEVLFFSMHRADLLARDFDNMSSRELKLSGYSIIASIYKRPPYK